MSTTDTTSTLDMDTEVITREYECAYLLVPTIPEEKLPEHTEKIKKTLTDHGAELANEKPPQRIPLAYEMTISQGGKNKRYLEGYFGWVTMEASPERMIEMRDELKYNYDLIRFMIIKAPKDQDPYADPEQSDEEDGVYVSPQSEEEQQKQSTEVSTEEIDKSIEKLVSTEETEEKEDKNNEKTEDENA